jgi:hypothetical protein
MDIYTALCDPIDGHSQKTDLVGVFSTEPKARDACQVHADEDGDTGPDDPGRLVLQWNEDSAEGRDGRKYVVILGDLDRRTGT